MSDLTDGQQSDVVRLAGSDASGVELGFIAQFNGQLETVDILYSANAGVVKALTTTAVALNVSGTNLANRKQIFLQAQSANIKFGFSAGTCIFNLPNSTNFPLVIGPGITVYALVTAGTGNIAVVEFA